MDTQMKIQEAARKLFNEKGYRNVSMRAIAAACGIAVGNLTYYYPHKQDIVTALMERTFTETKPDETITTLDGITDQFSRMLDTLLLNAFYFLDDEFSGSPRAHNRIIRSRLLEGFAFLKDSGYFTPAFTPDRQQEILRVLLMAHLTWLRNAVRASAMPKEEFLNLHWAMLAPYLTEKGQKELRS